MTPKPPGLLIRHIKEGRCVVFVGAGLSAGAGLPTWKKLLLDVITEMASSLPGGEREEEELRALVEQNKLLEVADHCKERLGSGFHTLLTDKLRGDREAIPDTFRLLMRTPFAAWVTTNYDKLLERAYSEERGGYPRVLTHMDTEPLGRLLFDGGQFVLKAHGDIDRHGTVVLTSRDYAEIIHANPSFNAVFSSLLLTRSLLFVGYSLSDPDFRLLMDRQFTVFKGFVPERYALMSGLGQVEQDVLWRTARIRVLPYPEGQHGEVLNFLRLLKEAVVPEVKPAPAAPAPAAAAVMPAPQAVPRPPVAPAAPAATRGPTPGAPPRAVLESTLGAEDDSEEVSAEQAPPSVAHGRVALSVPDEPVSFEAFTEAAPRAPAPGALAPRSAPPEVFQLTLGLENNGTVRARLTRGEAGPLAEGRMPRASLAELERCQEALSTSRSLQAVLPALHKAFSGCLPDGVREALGELAGARGRLLVLRTSPELERLPWELLPARDGLLALKCPLVRAPVGVDEAVRGRPQVRAPARMLLVGASAEDRETIERLTGVYADARAASCERLVGRDALPERVVERLETDGYDLVSLAGRVDITLGEAGLNLRGDAPLTASALRPGFNRTPPAFLVLHAAASAFLRGQDAFLRLATETGVGAFIGSFGALHPEAAEAFMSRLHGGLARGETAAEAVFAARLEAHQAFPDEPTPLQYVLSGDGSLRLR